MVARNSIWIGRNCFLVQHAPRPRYRSSQSRRRKILWWWVFEVKLYQVYSVCSHPAEAPAPSAGQEHGIAAFSLL